MIKLQDIVSTLRTDISVDLPPLLAAAGLTDFAVYEIGASRNTEQLGFFIYLDGNGFEFTRESGYISIVFHMQLYKISELDAMKYQDVVLSYLFEYPPARLGADMLMDVSGEMFPVDQTVTDHAFIIARWEVYADSCDNFFKY